MEPSFEGEPVLVAVDPNFVRLFADHTSAIWMGRDLDLVFLAAGQRIDSLLTSKRPGAVGTQLELTRQFNELARVRLSPPAAVHCIMSSVEQLITHGVINRAGLIEAIQQIDDPFGDEESGVDPTPAAEGTSDAA